jgi:hypothetical protein
VNGLSPYLSVRRVTIHKWLPFPKYTRGVTIIECFVVRVQDLGRIQACASQLIQDMQLSALYGLAGIRTFMYRHDECM